MADDRDKPPIAGMGGGGGGAAGERACLAGAPAEELLGDVKGGIGPIGDLGERREGIPDLITAASFSSAS